jgi:hypothetical protein
VNNNVSWLMLHNFEPKGVQKTVDRYTLCLFFPFSWSLLYGEAARLCGERLSGGVSRHFCHFTVGHMRTKRSKKICPPALDGYHHAALGKVFWRNGKVMRRSTPLPRHQKGRLLSLQRHLYEHVFKHKELWASKKPLTLIADDRKPAILHRKNLSTHPSDVVDPM